MTSCDSHGHCDGAGEQGAALEELPELGVVMVQMQDWAWRRTTQFSTPKAAVENPMSIGDVCADFTSVVFAPACQPIAVWADFFECAWK